MTPQEAKLAAVRKLVGPGHDAMSPDGYNFGVTRVLPGQTLQTASIFYVQTDDEYQRHHEPPRDGRGYRQVPIGDRVLHVTYDSRHDEWLDQVAAKALAGV